MRENRSSFVVSSSNDFFCILSSWRGFISMAIQSWDESPLCHSLKPSLLAPYTFIFRWHSVVTTLPRVQCMLEQTDCSRMCRRLLGQFVIRVCCMHLADNRNQGNSIMTIMDKASLSFALGLVRYEVELISNKLIDFLFIVSKI